MSAFVGIWRAPGKRTTRSLCVGLDPEIERFPPHIAAAALADLPVQQGDHRRDRGSGVRLQAAVCALRGLRGRRPARAHHRVHPSHLSGDPGDPRLQARRCRQHRRALRHRGLRALWRGRRHRESLPGRRLARAVPEATRTRASSILCRTSNPGGARPAGPGGRRPAALPGGRAIWPRTRWNTAATACWSSARPTRASWPRCARSSGNMPFLCPASARRAAMSRRRCATARPPTAPASSELSRGILYASARRARTSPRAARAAAEALRARDQRQSRTRRRTRDASSAALAALAARGRRALALLALRPARRRQRAAGTGGKRPTRPRDPGCAAAARTPTP